MKMSSGKAGGHKKKSCAVHVVVKIRKLTFAKMFDGVLNTLLGKNMFQINIEDMETIFALI